MFEATMTQVVVLRKIVESLKDLVTEVNIEATPTGKKRTKIKINEKLNETRFRSETFSNI